MHDDVEPSAVALETAERSDISRAAGCPIELAPYKICGMAPVLTKQLGRLSLAERKAILASRTLPLGKSRHSQGNAPARSCRVGDAEISGYYSLFYLYMIILNFTFNLVSGRSNRSNSNRFTR